MDNQNDQTQSNEVQAPADEKKILMDRARLMGITFSNNITVEKLRAKINEKLEGEADEAEAEAEADEPDQVDEDGDGHDDRDGTFVDGNQEAANEATAPSAGQDPEDDEPIVASIGSTELSSAPTPPPAAPAASARNPLAEVDQSPVDRKPAAQPVPARKLTKAEREQEIRTQLYNEQMALVRVRITNLNPSKKDLPGEIFTVGNKFIGTVKKYVPYGEQTENGYHIPRIIYEQLKERQFQNIRTVKDKRTGTPRVDTSWVREFALEVLPPLTEQELKDLAIAQAAAGSID